jgi:hypothetical protein
MKRQHWIISIAIALLVAGCVPKRYEWSPDGKWMTVISDAGLRFADAQGNLLPGTIEGVSVATWFPDSKRVLVARTINEKTWDALTPYLSSDQARTIADAGQFATDFLMTYEWNAQNPGTWDNFSDALKRQEQQVKRDPREMDAYGLAIGVYVRDHADNALREKIPPARWKELEDLVQPVTFIQIYNVDIAGATAGRTLMTTLKGVNELRVSPTGRAVLAVTDGQNDHVYQIWAMSADTQAAPLLVSDAANWYPDFSPDGRTIIFTRAITPAMGSEDMQLGSLCRATVIGDDSALLKQVNASQDLVALMYSSLTRIRCLKDGRIIFATANVTLPATSGDMPQHAELFVLYPGKQQTVSRLLSADAAAKMGDCPQYFEVSPDETFLSIPSKSGSVTVVNLATGTVMVVQDKPIENQNLGLMTVPAWRIGNELTMIAPGKSGHPAVTLWSASTNQMRTLSTDWPPGTVAEKPDNANPSPPQSATRP